MTKIETISHKNLAWKKIVKPSRKELNRALKGYKFKEHHLKACLPQIQRPRLEVNQGEYIFMILTFPVYNKSNKNIEHVEIDFFIINNEVITIQDKTFKPIDILFEEIKTNEDIRNRVIKKNPGHIIYEILNTSLVKSFPLLNKINREIENIEDGLFNGIDKGMIREILRLSHNIIDFRKSMTAHKAVIRKFINTVPDFFPINGLNQYFEGLVNYTKEIWDNLDNYHDTVNALQQSHDSLYQWRLNEIIKTLTMFSIVIFSVTFVATVFNMANNNGMPFFNTPHNFWKSLGVIAVVGSGVFLIFKKKKWL